MRQGGFRLKSEKGETIAGDITKGDQQASRVTITMGTATIDLCQDGV